MVTIEVETSFADFDDYWNPFLGGQGPAPTVLSSLDEPDRVRLRERLRKRLSIRRDQPIQLTAKACAARGTVPT